jgi:hypothetical protein
MRNILAFGAVVLLAAAVSFYGCEEKKTVTITHYFHNVAIDNASEGILGYSCYNIDNTDIGPHYGSVSVGGVDTYGGPGGNEMDFGFIAFDFGTLGLPNGAELTELTVYLDNLLPVDNGISIYVTLQDPPTDNTVQMIERICSGTLLCQIEAISDGLLAIQIDPASVTVHNGKLYLGLYSNAAYNDNKFIFCDPATSYARAKFTTRN